MLGEIRIVLDFGFYHNWKERDEYLGVRLGSEPQIYLCALYTHRGMILYTKFKGF